ncbi:unnamed protein product [Allacma fusca]|uniref:PDZ and LIM domain protein Zasp n=1 Tax=Allacma fusca TaxID=39272 RepID=A0A8J2JHL2_9HEXA|nr:unnamed protein product [Allacma fusca]
MTNSSPVPVLLTRATGQQWGFRLHGGSDFNQPLVILKVSGGSIAEQNNLSPGDAILAINGQDTSRLKHKDAQDLIARSGNTVEFIVQKGVTSTWKPNVSPVGSLSRDGKALVNNQFNSPINLYSEANIAETLSAQAEVLAGGAIGVNFKKNEKKYNYEDSEVYKMLKRVENEPEDIYVPEDRAPQDQERVPPPQLTQTISQLRPVRAPENIPKPVDQPTAGGNNPNLCAECERLIVGVFVRIKDKNLHVECFKCATCGQSLKNIGYFNINNKLYCDVHAQTIARNNPPAPGLAPFIPSVPSVPAPSIIAPSLGSSSGINIPISEPDLANNFASATPVPDLPLVASTDTTTSTSSNPIVLPSNDNSAPLLNTCTSSATAENLITVSSSSANTCEVSGDLSLFISANEDNRQFSYNKPDSYSANIAPQPFHHSPTRTSHVNAPAKVTQESSFLERKSFSETVTKSSPGGSKFVWPPVQGNDDPVMLGSPAAGSNIQQESSHQQQSSSSLSQSISQSSSLNHSNLLSGSPAQQPILPTIQAQAPSFAPSSFYQSQPLAQPYKPVAPPKPRAPQTPYRPLSTLLAPATRPAASAPITPPVQSYQPPPFETPSIAPSLGGGVSGLNLRKGQNVGRGIIPNRGRGFLTQPGPRVAVCGACQRQIRGPFITAGGSRFYCPEHFKCGTPNCSRPLIDIGFVEERGQLYCEYCWESYLAPVCAKCNKRVKNECLNALGQHFHPTCFSCSHCHVCFGNNPFYLEDGKPFCEKDWNELFTTKCYACGFPIEAGDRWVEALNQNYHSQCFNCSACKKNLEGQSFFAKGGRPFCKAHAR